MKINQRQQIKGNRLSGFTLLEMVIVLGIIGLILGGSISLMKGIKDGGAVTRVKGDFNSITSAIETYSTNNGFYPSPSQGLQALVAKPSGAPQPKYWIQLMTEVPKDPWSEPYVYKYPGSKGSGFELISKGKDKQLGTDDDFSSQQAQ